jgi:hypothetical protein
MPAEPQLPTNTGHGFIPEEIGLVYEPRSLVLAEIHAEPFFTVVPAPCTTDSAVVDILGIQPAGQRVEIKRNEIKTESDVVLLVLIYKPINIFLLVGVPHVITHVATRRQDTTPEENDT